MTEAQLKEFQATLEKSVAGTMETTLPKVVDEAFEKKFSSEIETKVNDALKAAGLDKMNLNGFAKGQMGSNQKETALKFFKAVFAKDREALKSMGAQFKTMNEGTDSAGGFLVPEEVMAEVDRAADSFGLMRKLSRVIPMGRDILNMPTLGSKPTVYWPGEAVAGTASQPVIKNVKLEARTAVGLTPVTNELMEDANIGIMEMLIELFAEQLAGEEDNQGLNGIGAPFTGVLNHGEVTTSTAIATHDTLAEVDLADLHAGIAAVKDTVLPGSVWIFHRTVWNTLVSLKEASQSLLAISLNPMLLAEKAGTAGLVPSGMLHGYPVYLSDKMPSAPTAGLAYGVFGNFSKFYFGNRKQMAISTSEHASVGGVNMWETNSQALRVIERIALAVGVPEAFVVMKLNAA